MTKIVRGDLFHSGADLICVTTNGQVKQGDLPEMVMGAGAAAMAKKIYPQFPSWLYEQVARREAAGIPYGGGWIYGFLWMPTLHSIGYNLGAFQTKVMVNQKSTLSLIGYSILSLNYSLEHFTKCRSVALNFPGVGLGGLRKSDVMPLLSDLDSRVTIYTL